MAKRLFTCLFFVGAAACTSTGPSVSLSGTVRSSTGSPVSGATVAIVDGPFAGKSATTAASGAYALSGLQAASFTVSVSSSSDAAQSWSVTLKSSQALDFVLGGGFSITGTVRDTAQTPVAGATMTIAGGPNNGRTTKTDMAGTYGFAGLQASSFTIKVTSSDWAPTTVVMTLPGDLVADVIMRYPPFVLTGRVLDANTSSPISGATVVFNGRYQGRSDPAGRYSVTGGEDGGISGNLAFATANGYEDEYRFIQTTTRDFHLRPSQRITAGASTSVTVSPTDTICVNNVQDDPFLWGPVVPVCRTVRVVAPSDGLLTVEAVSLVGAHPQVEAEAVNDAHCCTLENMGNPWSQQVTAGTEVIVNVEIQSNSATPQTFTLKTSMSRIAESVRSVQAELDNQRHINVHR
jgi:protocatechuate 3,4-dioxygenase beta subunit